MSNNKYNSMKSQSNSSNKNANYNKDYNKDYNKESLSYKDKHADDLIENTLKYIPNVIKNELFNIEKTIEKKPNVISQDVTFIKTVEDKKYINKIKMNSNKYTQGTKEWFLNNFKGLFPSHPLAIELGLVWGYVTIMDNGLLEGFINGVKYPKYSETEKKNSNNTITKTKKLIGSITCYTKKKVTSIKRKSYSGTGKDGKMTKNAKHTKTGHTTCITGFNNQNLKWKKKTYINHHKSHFHNPKIK